MKKDELINLLTSIEGIGKAKAEAIYNSGMDSIEKLRKASLEDLTKIKGISEELAKKIKEHVDKLEEKETKEKTEETKEVKECWRRPRGLHSKLRKGMKYRQPRVKIGFRVPKAARGLHPSGFEEVIVHTVRDLEGIDPSYQAVRIGGTVGTRKRIEIVKRADELNIRVLNRGEL